MIRSNYDVEPTVRTASSDEDAEWQRVNSYVADVLKDCYVLFAKLARLRGDFAGAELEKLDAISSTVRDNGQQLAMFSKSFTEGTFSMNRKEQYGDGDGGNNNGEVPDDGMGIEAPEELPTAEDFDFSEEDAEPVEEGGDESESEPDEEDEDEEPEEPEEE